MSESKVDLKNIPVPDDVLSRSGTRIPVKVMNDHKTYMKIRKSGHYYPKVEKDTVCLLTVPVGDRIAIIVEVFDRYFRSGINGMGTDGKATRKINFGELARYNKIVSAFKSNDNGVVSLEIEDWVYVFDVFREGYLPAHPDTSAILLGLMEAIEVASGCNL